MFTYRAAPESINNVNGDAGEFELWRNGEWLTKELCNYDNYGNGQSSMWHNTLALKNWCPQGIPTLNPFEQNYFPNGSMWNNGANAGDPVTLSSVGHGYDYLQTDMTPLFNRPSFYTPTNALLDIQMVSRSLLHLNRDYVVVYDRAVSLHPGLFKRFNLNLTTVPSIDPVAQVTTANTPHGQKLYVQTLLPTQARLAWVPAGNSISTYAETEPTIGRLVVEDTNNPVNIRFLHVLQAADATTPMDVGTLAQSTAGDAFDGVLLGDTVIWFVRTPGVNTHGTSYLVPGTTGTHYVTGLVPHAGYSVQTTTDGNGNLQVTISPGGNAMTDEGGLLYFNLNAGT